MNITDGPVPRAQRIVIYGPHGLGKSTLASQFPDPLFIDTEDGTSHLAVRRVAAGSYKELREVLLELRDSQLPLRTVVIDTVDHCELFLRSEVCRAHHIESIETPGYGKGWTFLGEAFGKFISEYLDPLVAVGIHTVVIGHSQVKRVAFPELDAFDRWELRLHAGCANRLKEWADSVLFLNWKTRVSINDGRSKAMGGVERAIFTQHSAAHDAKSRVALPDVVPCDFAAIQRLLCGWERPPQLSVQERFAEALKDLDSKQVLSFLIDRKMIRDGQNAVDVPAEYARAALGRIEEFRKTVVEFDFISI